MDQKNPAKVAEANPNHGRASASGINRIEIDHIAYLAMDVVFVIINFAIGYRLIYNRINVLNRGVKQVLFCLYTIIVVQALVSATMLGLVFLFSDDHNAQIFIAFKFARTCDLFLSSLVILLLFKFLFSLKRTEIQLDDENMTVEQTCQALKRYMYFERSIISFYVFSLIIIVFYVIWDTVQIIQRINGYQEILSKTVNLLWWIIVVYYPMLFVADVVTMVYFIRMAYKYVQIMSQWYTVNKCSIFSSIYMLAFQILINLFRYQIYMPLCFLLFFINGKDI